jgi:3-hydroxybutyryl-CoA dehydratase
MTAARAPQWYLDDLAVGQIYPGLSKTITEADFLGFATLTGDDHPIHYDEAFAKQSRFGGRVAHGLLLMAHTALGATPLSRHLEDSMIAFVGQGCRFLKPVLIGDHIRSELEVAEVAPTQGRNAGRLRLIVRLINQRGEIVLDGHHEYLFRLRPKDLPRPS